MMNKDAAIVWFINCLLWSWIFISNMRYGFIIAWAPIVLGLIIVIEAYQKDGYSYESLVLAGSER